MSSLPIIYCSCARIDIQTSEQTTVSMRKATDRQRNHTLTRDKSESPTLRNERVASLALTCLASFHFNSVRSQIHAVLHRSTKYTHHRTPRATAPRSHCPNSPISFSYRTSRIERGRFEVCIPDDKTSTMQWRRLPNRQPCHFAAMVTYQLLASNRLKNDKLRIKWFCSV